MKQGRSLGKGVLMKPWSVPVYSKPWSVPVYSCLFRTVERPESGEVVAFPCVGSLHHRYGGIAA
ncbi:MAG: hypothetical protein ACJAYC_003330 [Halieaceae bacterium]|jgi:hypothetical protein